MHGGEEIWEWAVCKRTAVRVFFSLLRDRCKLKKRKAEGQSQSLSRGVVKLTEACQKCGAIHPYTTTARPLLLFLAPGPPRRTRLVGAPQVCEAFRPPRRPLWERVHIESGPSSFSSQWCGLLLS